MGYEDLVVSRNWRSLVHLAPPSNHGLQVGGALFRLSARSNWVLEYRSSDAGSIPGEDP